MAKTLIGNIKGKNGRGIVSIKKTGTTGSADTYTITYTDDTTSTFTVNNSDSISLQRQIVPSAAIESSTTASQAYAVGNYVVVGGVLRKATAAIAKGDAISDSNSTATTVMGEVANREDPVPQTSLVSIKEGTNSFARKVGYWCMVSVDMTTDLPGSWGEKVLSTLPEGMRPLDKSVSSACTVDNRNDLTLVLTVTTAGVVKLAGRGKSGGGGLTATHVVASLSYACELP